MSKPRGTSPTPPRDFLKQNVISNRRGTSRTTLSHLPAVSLLAFVCMMFFFPQRHVESREPGGSDTPEECGPPQAMDDRDAPTSSRERSDRLRLHVRLPPGLRWKGCVWEGFRGGGQLSQTFVSHGRAVLPPIYMDIAHGPAHDLTRRSTQLAVIEMLLHSEVGYLHLGTPRTVFAQARRNIQNICRARERERVGCELALFAAGLRRNAHSKNIFWCIENPSSSRLWEFWAIKDLKMLDNVFEVRFPMCKYGMPYKKPI